MITPNQVDQEKDLKQLRQLVAIQIATSSGKLFGLSSDGTVWQYDFAQGCWKSLSMKKEVKEEKVNDRPVEV